MPSSSDMSLEPSLEFLRLIWRLNHAMERRSRHMLGSLGVTAPQRMVLRLVGRMPGIQATALAALLHVDPGTLSAALGRLEREQMLVREPDEGDARRVRLRLTTRGKRLDRETEGTVESAVATILRRTPRRRLAHVGEVLADLAAVLETAPLPDQSVRAKVRASRRRSPRTGRAPNSRDKEAA